MIWPVCVILFVDTQRPTQC